MHITTLHERFLLNSGIGLKIFGQTITVRLDEKEKDFISSYASVFGTTVSDFVRRAALERIEDEVDLKIAEDALLEFKENPTTYSNNEVKALFS